MSRRRQFGWALIIAGIVVPIAFAGMTWAQASSAPEWNAEQTLLVGVQGPTDHGKVVAIDGNGETIWQVSRAASYHDVSRLPSGNVLVTYAEGPDNDCGQFHSPCARTGIRILEPQPAAGTASIVAEWSYPVREYGNSELHDAELLANGRVLAVGMDRERVFTVDIGTGDVRHIWNASQFYDAPADPTKTDWLHMNDVDRIGDDRYLVSVRNRNQLLIIEEGEVAEVINKDMDPRILRGQHNPQWLNEGAVLVGDSSNDRVVELHRNNSTGEWRPVWAFERANGLRLAWPRDADRLPNGHTLITDSRNNRVLEVTERGEVVAIVRTPALPYEADLGGPERPGGATYAPVTGEYAGGGEFQLGVLSHIWVGIEHAWPLPYWLTEWHLAAALVGVILTNLGWMVLRVEFERGPI